MYELACCDFGSPRRKARPNAFVLRGAGGACVMAFDSHGVYAALRPRFLPILARGCVEGFGGGLIFPGGGKPDYEDFAYFSFVVGMTCQVSDVNVTSRPCGV
jgi:hypothetical protein